MQLYALYALVVLLYAVCVLLYSLAVPGYMHCGFVGCTLAEHFPTMLLEAARGVWEGYMHYMLYMPLLLSYMHCACSYILLLLLPICSVVWVGRAKGC